MCCQLPATDAPQHHEQYDIHPLKGLINFCSHSLVDDPCSVEVKISPGQFGLTATKPLCPAPLQSLLFFFSAVLFFLYFLSVCLFVVLLFVCCPPVCLVPSVFFVFLFCCPFVVVVVVLLFCRSCLLLCRPICFCISLLWLFSFDLFCCPSVVRLSVSLSFSSVVFYFAVFFCCAVLLFRGCPLFAASSCFVVLLLSCPFRFFDPSCSLPDTCRFAPSNHPRRNRPTGNEISPPSGKETRKSSRT